MKHNKGKSGHVVYGQDFRVKVVRTALEKNLSTQEVTQLYGISNACSLISTVPFPAAFFSMDPAMLMA